MLLTKVLTTDQKLQVLALFRLHNSLVTSDHLVLIADEENKGRSDVHLASKLQCATSPYSGLDVRSILLFVTKVLVHWDEAAAASELEEQVSSARTCCDLLEICGLNKDSGVAAGMLQWIAR